MDLAGATGRVRRLNSLRYALLAGLIALPLLAQGPPGGRGGGARAPQAPKASAPIDITGSWVPVITEDWKFRMVTAPKGESGGVPLNQEGRKLAMAWDPAKDEAEGNQCKAYGAAGVMRLPGRIRVSWQDDTTMKIETEAGTQTRLFAFRGASAAGDASWQGVSAANWEMAAVDPGQSKSGNLKVTTSRLKAGYLRKNGIPYSANAQVTEYYDLHKTPTGDMWLVVTTDVNDPMYLTQRFITSTHFKKLPDNAPWKPEACTAK
jgi:hypothetical protein